MMKKILMNSDLETARFDQLNNCWISRHGKRFSTESLARMHGSTHFYCQTCGVLTNKEKSASMLDCPTCSKALHSNIDMHLHPFSI